MQAYSNLVPYFKLAENEAKKSPCTRRQYGALIAYEGLGIEWNWYVSAHNERVTRCCNGNACARDRFNIAASTMTEIGAEIHAETALLIKEKYVAEEYNVKPYFILVGFAGPLALTGRSVYPCYACAKAIKFAGYKYIYTYSKPGVINQLSIERVLEEWEETWQPA